VPLPPDEGTMVKVMKVRKVTSPEPYGDEKNSRR